MKTLNIRLSSLIAPLCAVAMTMALAVGGCGSSNNSSPSPKHTPTTTPSPTPTLSVALWVANGTNVLEFAPSQLLVPGATSPIPTLTNNSAAFGAPQGVTFDSVGDLWVIDGGTVAAGGTIPPALDEFTPAQLSALSTNPAPAPNVQISFIGFKFPQQAVFDTKGDLWVSDNGSNAVFEYTPAQLAAGGANLLPNAGFISSVPFTGPLGIAFDATGNLWIANNGDTSIFEFNAASLPLGPTAGVILTPNVILSDDGAGSIQGPWALIFDAAGNLWSSNANTPDTIVEFAKSMLGTTGAPVPAVTISPTTVVANEPSLIGPNGIAFDNLGDLAAANSLAPFSISFFSKAQLGASGATVPGVFFSGTPTLLNAPAGDVFGPLH